MVVQSLCDLGLVVRGPLQSELGCGEFLVGGVGLARGWSVIAVFGANLIAAIP